MKIIKIKLFNWALGVIAGTMVLGSCVDDFAVGDSFLEKQPGVDVTLDTIFSKSEYAKMFLWDTYKYMYHGLSQYNCCNSAMPEAISDVVHSNLGWSDVINAYYSAMHSEAERYVKAGNLLKM